MSQKLAKKLTAGALFSGIGGFCLGFERVGIRTIWAIENDHSATVIYRENFPNVRLIERDIKKVTVEEDKLESVDILHAGFPCQSFSQAGTKKGFDDPRGRLFFEIIRIINEFKDKKPAVLVLENAPYLRYGDGGTWFLELSKAIKKAGYWFGESNCAELDAFTLTDLPQKRKRLFMVAFSVDRFKNGRFQFPEPTTDKNHFSKDLSRFIQFSGELEDSSYYLNKENKYYKMILKRAESKINRIYQLRKYTVRVKEPGVCPTLTANMGLGGHNVPFVFDKKGLRKLTERECLRLQGFPESFKFPETVPRAKRYLHIGNSVAIPVIELLADKIKHKMIKEMD